MKLCIPTETQDGKQAKVHSHFGSAPYFVIYDTDSETSDVIDNPNQHHVHGACHPMMALSGRKISAVICGGIGLRAVQKLHEGGIKAYKAAGRTVSEIIEQYKTGQLEEITTQTACSQHNCS